MDLSQAVSLFSRRQKVVRTIWGCAWLLLFRPSPKVVYFWRRWLLRAFGARIGHGVKVENSVRVFYPANLTLGDFVAVGPSVDLYCVAPITIHSHSVVSQYSHLCAASHDFRVESFPMTCAPITIGSQVWICAGAFVGPGVTLGDRAVLAARAVVVRDVAPGVVMGGNPARPIKHRDGLPID
jgi:putative colanic acid biosynthesis acetyltransferase WcaF